MAAAAVAAIVLVAGAFYCSGYELLTTGRDNWPASLLWSAYAVLPWYALFEFVKRREWVSGQQLPVAAVALMIVVTAAVSITAEAINDHFVAGGESSPLALQVLRRLPAIAVLVLLLLLARFEYGRALHRHGFTPNVEGESSVLLRRAAAVRWIKAADNYLEMHFGDEVVTVRGTLATAERVLAPFGFVRVHRSFLVNRSYVTGLVARTGGKDVRLSDGTVVPTGHAFRGNLERLG